MLRLAVFASGFGSNLEAIYQSIASGALHGVELALVISNNSVSGALAFAREKGIPGRHLSLVRSGNDAHKLESEMLEVLHDARIDIIALAGFMKKLPEALLDRYQERIINIHPALLPEFGGNGMYGLNVHNAVIASGRKISGATVHMVEGEYDSGKIILQESCPVFEKDTPKLLSERVKEIEHRLLPEAIQIMADKITKSR